MICLFLAGLVVIIHSCKRDYGLLPLVDHSVNETKTWYESNYPSTGSATLITGNSVQTPLYQLIKSDWRLAVSYTRSNKNVVEIPLDSTVKFGLGNDPTNFNFKKNPSKTSFLILNDGKNHTAYIIVIVGETSYLQSNYNKILLNTYKKRDVNFTGAVFYYTPEGKLVNGWHYLNGKLDKTISPKIQPTNLIVQNPQIKKFIQTQRA